jgi:2-haloacid dehalogenase
VADRWVTFDCYGTLIDWNGGIGREFERLFGSAAAARLLHRYHELEPAVQAEDPMRTYREVLDLALARLAATEGLRLPAPESDALSRSLPGWAPFPEVPAALERLRARGWRLAVLSNSDPDLLAASLARIGVAVELTVVASEIGSYKPAVAHWRVFAERSGADPRRHVHVAASLFHDVAPAVALGVPVVWINRLGEEAEPVPARELNDLERLPETLDELVPE